MKTFKGYLITGNPNALELGQLSDLTNLGPIYWTGNDRKALDVYLDQFPDTVGVWYPEVGYFLRYLGFTLDEGETWNWEGNYYVTDSMEYRCLEAVRLGANPKPQNNQKLLVFTLRDAHGDCTNNGLTKDSDALWMYSDENAAISASYYNPVLLYKEEDLGFAVRRSAYPVVGGKLRKGMFGGNHVTTSDSRFKEFFTEEASVKVFDRFE